MFAIGDSQQVFHAYFKDSKWHGLTSLTSEGVKDAAIISPLAIYFFKL